MERPNNVRGLDGRFAKGQSGNSGGRPKDEARVAELARGTVAQALLERGWGKPKVEVVADGAGS